MSFLFGSSKNISPPDPRPFGAHTERLSTNESARVLPWFAGTRWLGVTWLGDAFGVRTEPIRQKVGKKQQTVGHLYYASFVALVSCGPVDHVTKIKFDDEIVWEGLLQRGGDDYASITIESRGVIHLHWGTETQVVHPLLSGSGQNHSSYRGQCYIIGDDILFGADRTNAPNIQIELTRVGKPSWFNVPLMIEHDANPMSVLWEWWTNHRYGLGRAESELNLDELDSVARRLNTDGLGISPLLTTDADMKSLILQLLEHIDGYPTSTGGKLGVSLIRPTSGSVPLISASGLQVDPSISMEQWQETHDETRVRFKDHDNEGQDNMAKHHERANFVITGHHKAQNLDRPWITRHNCAAKIAGAVGRVVGLPQAKGRLNLRESQASSINVGSVFDLQTRDGELLRMRCVGRSEADPDKRLISVEFVSDTGWANDESYVPTPSAIPSTPIYEPAKPFDNVVQDAPYGLASDRSPINNPHVLWFVARDDRRSTGYDVWKSNGSTGPFLSASDRRDGEIFNHFSVKARLASAYESNTLTIDDVTGIAFDVVSPDQSLLDDEWDLNAALDHELLAFVGEEATEIMSLFNVAKTGDASYTADVVRGLYDTKKRSHVANTPIWLQLRSKLDSYSWPPFTTSTRYYKFQPYFGPTGIGLGHVDILEHSENGRTLLPITPRNLRVNGDGHHATWTTGQDVTVTWSNTSRARTVFGLPLNETPPTDLTAVRLELRSYDGTTLHDTTEVSPTGESTTLTNSYLVTNVNADFSLRAYGLRNGFVSLDYDEVFVRKV